MLRPGTRRQPRRTNMLVGVTIGVLAVMLSVPAAALATEAGRDLTEGHLSRSAGPGADRATDEAARCRRGSGGGSAHDRRRSPSHRDQTDARRDRERAQAPKSDHPPRREATPGQPPAAPGQPGPKQPKPQPEPQEPVPEQPKPPPAPKDPAPSRPAPKQPEPQQPSPRPEPTTTTTVAAPAEQVPADSPDQQAGNTTEVTEEPEIGLIPPISVVRPQPGLRQASPPAAVAPSASVQVEVLGVQVTRQALPATGVDSDALAAGALLAIVIGAVAVAWVGRHPSDSLS